MQMKRLILPVILLSILSSCKSVPSKTEITFSKPNIIYINVDDLGWMDTETYGSTFYETPNISKLAKKGMTFTNGYAAAANCAPSRACLMSGQNTPRHGVYTVANSDRGNAKTRKIIPTQNTLYLADSIVTVAEMLKQNGYVTGTFGKWHLGDDPRTQGFDVNVGGNHRGNPGRDGHFSPYNIQFIDDNQSGENLSDRLTQEAITFIQQHKAKPFFVYLPYYDVHTPLQTSPQLKEKYNQKGGNEWQSHAAYAGMVETVDRNVGRILDVIEQNNLKNTFIVFTSDNGGIRDVSSQHPLRAGKGSYYEGGIRVPYIMSWPGVIEPNTHSSTPISNLDFYPTCMDIVDVEMSQNVLDGVSILPVLKGDTIHTRALYFHFPIYLQAYAGVNDDARDSVFRTRPGSVIIEDDWKLHHYYEDDGLELYHLKTDLGERNNLVHSNPEKRKELLKKLTQWIEKLKAPIPTDPNPAYDPDYLPPRKLTKY